MIHLDTHVVVWLAAAQFARLSPRARTAIETEDRVVSPMVLLELDMLHERGRIDGDAAAILTFLAGSLGVSLSSAAFAAVIDAARAVAWTRDPFDRLIVANATADGARLITADRLIRERFDAALW